MKFQNSIWCQSTLAVSISLIVLSASIAISQEQLAEEVNTDTNLEEIIVYGIRQSLETALAEKRGQGKLN